MSTIDPNVPATNAPLESAPIRNNFAAANTDVTALETGKADQTSLDAHTGAANPHSGSAPDPVATANISNDAVTNAKLANMAANTVKLRVATTGDPTDSTINALAPHVTPGAGDELLAQKAGGDLVKIDVGNLPTGGGGEANLGANVGAGTGQSFRDKTGVTLNFKTLRSSDATVTITNEADTINLQAAGGGGDVTGPASSGDNNIPLFNGTTGKVLKDSGVPETDVPLVNTTNDFTQGQTQDALDYTGTNPAINLDNRNHIRLTNASPGTPTIAGGNGSLHGIVTESAATLTLSNFTVRGTIPSGANKEFTIRRFGTGAANNIWRWLPS